MSQVGTAKYTPRHTPRPPGARPEANRDLAEWRIQRVKDMIVTNLQTKYGARFSQHLGKKVANEVVAAAKRLLADPAYGKAVDRNPTLKQDVLNRWIIRPERDLNKDTSIAIRDACYDVKSVLENHVIEDLSRTRRFRNVSPSKANEEIIGLLAERAKKYPLPGQTPRKGTPAKPSQFSQLKGLPNTGGAALGKTPKQRGDNIIKILKDRYKNAYMIREAFKEIDDDHSGFLRLPEVLEFMRKSGIDCTDGDGETIMHMIDKDKSGAVSYAEFIEKLQPGQARKVEDLKKAIVEKLATQFKHMRDGFRQMDKDRSGTIDFQELKTGLARYNLNFPDETVKYLLDCTDAMDSDGQIDYGEFCKGLERSSAKQEKGFFRQQQPGSKMLWGAGTGAAGNAAFHRQGNQGILNDIVYESSDDEKVRMI